MLYEVITDAAASAGFDREALTREWPRSGEIPFDARRCRMTTSYNFV